LDIQKEIERIAYKCQSACEHIDSDGYRTYLGCAGDNFRLRAEAIAEDVLDLLGKMPESTMAYVKYEDFQKMEDEKDDLTGRRVLIYEDKRNYFGYCWQELMELKVSEVTPSGKMFKSGDNWYKVSSIFEVLKK
jgi:hypothetical protein